MKDKKQIILKFLKTNGRSSTTRIASKIKSDIWMAKEYLKQLEEEGKITQEPETRGVYWEIRK